MFYSFLYTYHTKLKIYKSDKNNDEHKFNFLGIINLKDFRFYYLLILFILIAILFITIFNKDLAVKSKIIAILLIIIFILYIFAEFLPKNDNYINRVKFLEKAKEKAISETLLEFGLSNIDIQSIIDCANLELENIDSSSVYKTKSFNFLKSCVKVLFIPILLATFTYFLNQINNLEEIDQMKLVYVILIVTTVIMFLLFISSFIYESLNDLLGIDRNKIKDFIRDLEHYKTFAIKNKM